MELLTLTGRESVAGTLKSLARRITNGGENFKVAPVLESARFNSRDMTTGLEFDLKQLQARAFDQADWAENCRRRYHLLIPKLVTAVEARALAPDSEPVVHVANKKSLLREKEAVRFQ